MIQLVSSNTFEFIIVFKFPFSPLMSNVPFFSACTSAGWFLYMVGDVQTFVSEASEHLWSCLDGIALVFLDSTRGHPRGS